MAQRASLASTTRSPSWIATPSLVAAASARNRSWASLEAAAPSRTATPTAGPSGLSRISTPTPSAASQPSSLSSETRSCRPRSTLERVGWSVRHRRAASVWASDRRRIASATAATSAAFGPAPAPARAPQASPRLGEAASSFMPTGPRCAPRRSAAPRTEIWNYHHRGSSGPGPLRRTSDLPTRPIEQAHDRVGADAVEHHGREDGEPDYRPQLRHVVEPALVRGVGGVEERAQPAHAEIAHRQPLPGRRRGAEEAGEGRERPDGEEDERSEGGHGPAHRGQEPAGQRGAEQ